MPDSDGLFQLFNEIGIIAQLSQTLFEKVAPAGMTVAQFTVLNHFVRLGGERAPAELAKAFQVTKATMTSTLQRLEAKGLICVAPDPNDGRAKKVTITEAGLSMREACLQAVQPDFERIVARAGDLDLADIVPRLARLRDVLDKARG